MTEPSRESAPWGDAYPPANPQPMGASWPYVQQRSAPSGLGIASIILAIVLTVVEVTTAIASFSAVSDFRENLESGLTSWDIFTLYDGLELLLFPAMLAAYVVSCLWLQFARSNALVIDPRVHHQRSPVWVWLGWWVPIVAFWFPYQVIRDVQEGSRGHRPPLPLGAWWTAWLVYMIGNRMTANAASSNEVSVVGLLPYLELVTAGAAIAGCILWCRLVRTITDDQRKAFATLPR